MEIISKEGAVHFRRYRLLSLPFLSIFIHQILRSDQEAHMHDHPQNFRSLILKGSYSEDSKYPPFFIAMHTRRFKFGDLISHRRDDMHRITLRTPVVWSLFIATGPEMPWGYLTKDGWIPQDEYRKLKREEKLP